MRRTRGVQAAMQFLSQRWRRQQHDEDGWASWARARRTTARTGRPRSAEVQPSRGTAVGVTEIKTDGADDRATREAFFGFDTRLPHLEM